MGRVKWNNVGWRWDEPTELITNSFREGIIKVGDRVLDIGCGLGRNSNWLASKGVLVTAVNIDNKEIDEAMKKAVELGVYVNYFWAEATNLPLANNDFEVVIDAGCSHMLPNKESQERMEKEVFRILKPGGHLIYFGFSKKHPAYFNKLNSPMFRDLDEIERLYSRDFEIISVEEISWPVKAEEKVNYKKHVGLNILMRKKINRER